jgi:hypothetical protein
MYKYGKSCRTLWLGAMAGGWRRHQNELIFTFHGVREFRFYLVDYGKVPISSFL